MARENRSGAKAPSERTKAPPRPSRTVPTVIVLLIVVNTAIEVALSLADADVWAGQGLRPFVFYLGAFYPSLMTTEHTLFPYQEVSMFVTYAFLHGGLVHLTLNMLALFLFGTAIIERVGTQRFLLAYAISAVIGALTFAALGDGQTPMVGASGALFGLLGVWSCWDYLEKRFFRASFWETYRSLFYLLLYNLAFMALMQGQIAWEAHLGGFIAGWLMALYWGRPIYRRYSRRESGNHPTN